MVVQTDWENEEAIIYLQHRMARMGVDDALIKAGCKNGDEVRILGYAFDFEGIDDDEDYEDDVEFIEFDVDDEELATEDSRPEVGEEDPDVLA
ncbi:GTPase Obg [Collinsella intestinalis]|nr:GTPase Obg [Collinsella intestinalis]